MAIPCHGVPAPQQTLRVPAQVFEDNSVHLYFVSALKLALAKTESTSGQTKIIPDPFNATQDRLLRQVKEGTTDVTWAVTSVEREREHLAVYFPLARGLLGYRLMLIHPNRQAEFNDITTAQLKKLVAVQGIGWPDTDVLRFNGYRVEEEPFSMLFKLIHNNMADFFPRSAIEIQNEVDNRPQFNLLIEKSTAFYYPSPMYFFVNKQNVRLAERIHRGLDIALKDGSLMALYQGASFASSAEQLLNAHRVIELKNPVLSKRSIYMLTEYKDFLISH
ncbi:transporter substrate-binding domain-containing protein [Alteromonas lipolytica]|uniref:transporter substrate-binding domain-containing protein n=1 Tax=Alteromonas lipolytica TaxID=1856405 RepID=UPI0015861375|nr:transporter substrate-binding domain-containing protein [Alteromonas lipolytica]